MKRCSYLLALILLCCTAVLAAGLAIVSCPQFLVTGHANPITYHWQGTKAQDGTLTVFRLNTEGAPVTRLSETVALRLQPSKHTFSCCGNGLASESAQYLLRLAAGEGRAEARAEVQAWDLIGAFHMPFTEDRNVEGVIEPVLGDPLDDLDEDEADNYTGSISRP